MSLEKENHVLIIYPHPDDEAFGVAGTIMTYRDMGVPVTYACLTYGDMGRNIGNPPVTRETLSKLRKQEQLEAARLMDLDVRFLDYRDKTLEFENQELLENDIRKVIEDTEPTRLITFYPGYSVHPDHEATAEAVLNVVAEMEESKRPTLTLVAFDKRTFADLGEPTLQTDIKKYAERKKEVLAAHKSQTEKLLIELCKDTQFSKEARERWFEKENFYYYDINDWKNKE
ncbi:MULTISPECIES: bacillithiol biosynthesis deacetylase BshB2 [Nosocomiicoccus]|uniref:Bacillithiol biosynthesis deacetylase BshB2 n=1 Tax=Nosocomiicoccus massiliensis TaxID=1232430 RepID=A0AAF0YGN0_9STAP|nr:MULTISPECIES: bacillithiol biosynthesis deacetylase BshB2 [Nosocomiicoccus]MDK6863480.1 bacillithiol biosynthesis deacetylase BshB2 [Nosocomiicoccus ampullae]OFL46961.1 bacillithiol biosynthesis deacetylase BshB2 [Nosocomiicoccus sp. HMSC067E10]OFO52407.1 bacillithiol biosynthesis deacetylase BshB2 [Nosocomiicoccus sp. HMSC059G07]WOS95518.1 bacillithiol biosynthesis deacetylase BshB2 [Nosocomiicoccus massiliensis]